jgi:hypothetical protein
MVTSLWTNHTSATPVGVIQMKNRSDTYRQIYAKYREDREKEISELKQRVRDLERLLELIATRVFKDE